MTESLKEKFGRATVMAGNDRVELQRLANEFSVLLDQGHPEALEIYREQQADMLGADPLAEGAFEWPDELAQPYTVVDVPRSAPLYGWRMWGLAGTTLVAPFVTAKWGIDRKAPGVEWKPGANKNSTKHCGRYRPPRKGRSPQSHPLPKCRCGIRVVQSRTVLDAFASSVSSTIGAPAVIAQVTFWGRVASYAPDDDWNYTVRAQHAQIHGELEVSPEYAHLGDALASRYGVV